MNTKLIRTTALALVGALVTSCAPIPYQSYQTYDQYGGGGYPVQRQSNPNDVATAAAIGVAGLAAYGYLKERKDRKKLQRDRNYHHNGGYSSYGGGYPYNGGGGHENYGYGGQWPRSGW